MSAPEMFTGIVSDIGKLLASESVGDGPRRLTIACGYPAGEIAIGSSIACSGVCLTVVDRSADADRGWFSVEAAAETVRITRIADWRIGRRINLERALRMGEEIGGHLVTGHIDGLATVIAREDVAGSARLTLRAPRDLSRFIASKGSVSLDGVSLTVNEVKDDTFSVLIIPHTLHVTTLGDLRVRGEEVNLEVDLIARYAARLLDAMRLPNA
jgi:riboflavin synthase